MAEADHAVVPIERAHEIRFERQVRWVISSVNAMTDEQRREFLEAVQFAAAVGAID